MCGSAIMEVFDDTTLVLDSTLTLLWFDRSKIATEETNQSGWCPILEENQVAEDVL